MYIFYILEDGDVYGVKTVGFIMLLLFVILLQYSLKYQKFILAIKKRKRETSKKERNKNNSSLFENSCLQWCLLRPAQVLLVLHFLKKKPKLMLICQNYLFVYTNQIFLYKAVHSCLVYSSRYNYVESIKLDVFLLLIS